MPAIVVVARDHRRLAGGIVVDILLTQVDQIRHSWPRVNEVCAVNERYRHGNRMRQADPRSGGRARGAATLAARERRAESALLARVQSGPLSGRASVQLRRPAERDGEGDECSSGDCPVPLGVPDGSDQMLRTLRPPHEEQWFVRTWGAAPR